jgi:hypothetical protein
MDVNPYESPQQPSEADQPPTMEWGERSVALLFIVTFCLMSVGSAVWLLGPVIFAR